MARHERQRGARVHEYAGHRAETNRPAKSTKPKWRPHKSKTRLEEPTAVMVGQPAPGLIPHERPPEEGIVEPIAVAERRPAHPNAIGLPTVTVPSHGKPGAVGVQIAEAG